MAPTSSCARCGAGIVPAPDAPALLRCPECGGRLEDAASPEIPSTLRELFDVESELGRGACGVVFLARERGRGERRALKVLTRGGRDVAERFRREGQALASLVHPRVVRVFAVHDQADPPYLSCEYVEGGTLRQELAREKALTQARATQVIGDLLEALAVCHERGIVHRDVKPENVLFDAVRRAKLADLGVARFENGDAAALAQPGAPLAPSRYLAPEQLRDEKAGPSADLFAAGVILHEMLTGGTPFDASTSVEVQEQQSRGVQELPGANPLARLHRALLAYAPADRPASARAALDLLRATPVPNPISGPGALVSSPHLSPCPAVPRPAPRPVPLVTLTLLALLGLAVLYLTRHPAPPPGPPVRRSRAP